MTKKAWHFVGETLRDGSPIPPDGEWLEFTGKCVMCESGLHASYDPFDALQYAPGSTLCLVEIDGIEEEQSDKVVCRRRRIVARMDATELLRYFARMQALSVIHLWDAPDIVLDYLMTGDESQRAAARAAANAAAWATANAAANAAANADANADAWAAANAAKNAASWAAANVAKNAATKAAAYAAAHAASWAAANAAASAAAKTDFNQLIHECFEEYL